MHLKGFLIPIVLSLFILFTSNAYANEGDVKLRPVVNHSNRCLASSHTNASSTYTVLISCRDLNYTPTASVISYILWASLPTNQSPLRVGNLGLGKAEFTIAVPFNSLFVTIEQNSGAREPEGQVIMRGNVEPYEFLDPTRPTPTFAEELPDKDAEIQITPTPESGISGLLKRGGVVVSIILLGLLIGFIFIITRPRK